MDARLDKSPHHGPDGLQPLLHRLEEAATAEQVRFAVEAIAATEQVEAVPVLIKALGYNNPGAAVAAVEGLIQIGEPAVLPLIELLDGFNYGARAWALRALSGIGDPRGMDLVVQASLEDFALSVRRAAARGVGTLRWEQFATAERQAAQGRAIETLIQVCRDPEWVVRYAAVTGLEALLAALSVDVEQTVQPQDSPAHDRSSNSPAAPNPSVESGSGNRAGSEVENGRGNWVDSDDPETRARRLRIMQQLKIVIDQDETPVVRARARLALARSPHRTPVLGSMR